MRTAVRGLRRAEISTEDGCVGIDASVTKEGPVPSRLLDQSRIASGDQHGRFCTRFGKDTAERITDEGMTEELESVGTRLGLEADAVRRRDEDAIGDCVRALNGAPRLDLRLAELGFLGRM